MTSAPTIKLLGSNIHSSHWSTCPIITAEVRSAELGKSNVISFPKPEVERGARNEAHHYPNRSGHLPSWNDPIHEVLHAFKEARGERWWER